MIVKCGNSEVELYDSMQNLEVLRFQKFNKYQMQSLEIGSTFADYDKRTERTYEFLKKNMIAEAMQELNNRRQMVYQAFNEYNPTGKALAILVKRIDTRIYKDYSPNSLDEILQKLDDIGFSYELAVDSINEVKKK